MSAAAPAPASPNARPWPTPSAIERLFDEPAETVARSLIGALLLMDGVGGRIVETEVHGADCRSHGASSGGNQQPAGLEGPGRVFLSFIGRHSALKVGCDSSRRGSGVVIRSLEPTAGTALMEARRGTQIRDRLCSGPGRLCQALAIDRTLNGDSLLRPPFHLILAASTPVIVQVQRIEISRDGATGWRFGMKGSPYLSRPVRRGELRTG